MPSFDDHLESLRAARREAEAVIAVHCPGLKRSDEVCAASWDRLFDYFQKPRSKAKLDELNTVAGILFKLTQSTQQLKALEHKTREFEAAWQKLKRTKNEARDLAAEPRGLPSELRAEIEHDLSLLS